MNLFIFGFAGLFFIILGAIHLTKVSKILMLMVIEIFYIYSEEDQRSQQEYSTSEGKSSEKRI